MPICFADFFGKNILKIITSVPGPSLHGPGFWAKQAGLTFLLI
jgi:hypothetical protein